MSEFLEAHCENCKCDHEWYNLMLVGLDDTVTFTTEECKTCHRNTWPIMVDRVPQCACFAAQCTMREEARSEPRSFITTLCPDCGEKTLPVLSE